MQKFWQSVWFNLTHITFKGRTSKKEYLYWFLFGLLVSFIFWLFISVPASYLKPRAEQLSTVASISATLYLGGASIIAIVFSIWKALADITIIVRRFHDLGKSAWWSLLGYWVMASVILVLTVVIFAIIPGCSTIGLIVTSLMTIIFYVYYVGVALFKNGDEFDNKFGAPPEH